MASRKWILLRKSRFYRSLISAFGLLGVGLWITGPRAPLLIYNATASAPIGLYRVLSPSPAMPGDLVLARTPWSVRMLAAERGYIPAKVPLVKRVAAISGDTVCAVNRSITINGRIVAEQPQSDGHGRPMPTWRGCRRLGDNEIFLLMEGVPSSFDGRYFGPVSVNSIVGRLTPLTFR